MTTVPLARNASAIVLNHRVETAQRKRELMRRRIIEATIRVFAYPGESTPVIQDVVREAMISRTNFYKHFSSLNEALVAAGIEANDRMIVDMLPLYDFLKEPWQRASVSFRLFLLRASQDPKWAGFVTRIEAWPHESAVASYMRADFELGMAMDQFHMDDAAVAIDFVMGACAGLIQTLRGGAVETGSYIDNAVRVLLQALGCSPELRNQAEAFSRKHLHEWIHGERTAWKVL